MFKHNLYTIIAAAFLIVLMLFTGGYIITQNHQSAKKVPPPALLFHDDFTGSALDGTKWNTCYEWRSETYDGCTNGGNHELQWYKPTQVTVADGRAQLTAIKQDVQGDSDGTTKGAPGPVKSYPYTSGMLSTGKYSHDGTPKWANRYGYYEMRAQLPSGKGIWPAFWLLPVDGKWPPEIDIMEFLGHEPNKVHQTYFWNNGQYPPPKDTTIHTGADYTKGWHTYAIDWQPGKLTWYIDGEQQKTVESSHVPDKHMQIIINLAVGGTLPGNPTDATVFPKSMQIDYVRVYASKP